MNYLKIMIYTLTPNPALDIGGTVDQVVPNEKNYVLDETRYPGGNGINVARVIKRLQGRTVALGFVGGGIGDEIERLLKKEKVPCQFTRIAGNSRVNVTISVQKSHQQTRLSFQGPRVRPQELKKFIAQIQKIKKGSGLLIGGSLPPGFSAHQVRSLVTFCHKKNIPCWVDIPATDLKKVITSRPSFIKPNLVEFQHLIGRKIKSLKQVLFEIEKLHHYIPLICVSSVEGGAVLSNRQGAWFGRIPQVKIRSSVGAGDSMVAGILAKLDNGGVERLGPAKVGELLRWGLASSCATLVQTGTELGHLRDIKKFYRQTKVERIR